ncbi:MAG: hypothetical protein IKK59_07410 [Lachnospiraceae bacterium]|nr:hypothetical protein [Lachnospiraceae bacterium]
MSIWQMLEYFLVVSIVALLLLAMKRLFHDKLDARWHYLIWMVLGVRMLAPLSMDWLKSPLSLFEAIPVNFWTKLWALRAERAGIVNLLEGLRSVYLVGALVFLGYYLMVALMVHIKVFRMNKADKELCDNLSAIAEKYGLKSCRRVRVGEGAMPCVCGLLSPVLVLPVEGVPEEVIVHELLHKKHGDVLINYVLHIVRILNWFNPLIWYVTAVILNDSEALCDQRVLELMTKVRRQSGKVIDEGKTETDIVNDDALEKATDSAAVEKNYGNILLRMASKKKLHGFKIGTTNMANSCRNMHTRIKRIVDFRRVPEGVGFVALCITIILSVASIGYCEAKNIVSCGVEDKKDLERVMLRALTYEAETKEQALYLYLKAMKEMNPIYLMAVAPKEELPALEEWIWEMFSQDKFVRWIIRDKSYIGNAANADYYSPAEWLNFREEILENPWFVYDGNYMTDCRIYNLCGDGKRGTATAELSVKEQGGTSFVNWVLELLYQEGWKVKRILEEVHTESRWQEEPKPMIMAEGTSGDWSVQALGYNEARFFSLFQSNFGWQIYQGSIPTVKEKEEMAEYPKQFDMQYKNTYVYAVYQGDEQLDGKKINIAFHSFTEEEFIQDAGSGMSWAELPLETLMEQEVYLARDALGEAKKWSGDNSPDLEEIGSVNYSSSDGKAWRAIDGNAIENDKRILISGGGGGYDGWDGTEKLHFIAWIYYDGVCVEVIRQ